MLISAQEQVIVRHMGILLIPLRPTKAALRKTNMPMAWKYTWDEWASLKHMLKNQGVDTSAMAETNDGDRLPAMKCREIADIIERQSQGGSKAEIRELGKELFLWRNSGGFKQC